METKVVDYVCTNRVPDPPNRSSNPAKTFGCVHCYTIGASMMRRGGVRVTNCALPIPRKHNIKSHYYHPLISPYRYLHESPHRSAEPGNGTKVAAQDLPP